VRRDPTQYLWGYARWGAELAARLTAEVSTPAGGIGDRHAQRN
jgi:hypothetical protein